MLASHAFDEFEVIEFRSSMCTDARVHGISVPGVSEGLRPTRETGSRSESKSEGIRCVRGSLFALGFEAAAALGIYGIWEIWHILR
jgi:hypothetical protein